MSEWHTVEARIFFGFELLAAPWQVSVAYRLHTYSYFVILVIYLVFVFHIYILEWGWTKGSEGGNQKMFRRTTTHHAAGNAAGAQTRLPGPESRSDAKQRQNSYPPAR